jgi:RimJ/RimL family protein N-acetyltransferase
MSAGQERVNMSVETRLGALVEGWRAPAWPGDDSLTGQHVRLERLSAKTHAAGLHAANAADDAIWDYLPYGPFDTEASYAQWVAEMAAGRDPHFWAVRDLATGQLGGVLSYLRINPEAGAIEVGHITFAPRLQRSIGATEAVYLLMAWAFEAGYRRFEWKCNALNLGSRRAAQRFGFSYEGVSRQAMISKGRNRDTAWFACIDAEWPALKAAYAAWFDPDNFDAQGRQIAPLGQFTGPIRVADDPAL